MRLAAEGNLSAKQDAFIAELKKIPGVTNASATQSSHGWSQLLQPGLNWSGKDPADDNTYFEGFVSDYGFIETMGMHIKEGRSFSKNFGTDSSAIILNEAAVNAMHLKNPVGKTVVDLGKNMQVIGVVKDFHFESMHEAIKPSFLVLVPKGGTNCCKH